MHNIDVRTTGFAFCAAFGLECVSPAVMLWKLLNGTVECNTFLLVWLFVLIATQVGPRAESVCLESRADCGHQMGLSAAPSHIHCYLTWRPRYENVDCLLCPSPLPPPLPQEVHPSFSPFCPAYLRLNNNMEGGWVLTLW